MQLATIKKYIESNGFLYDTTTKELTVPENFAVVKCRHQQSSHGILSEHLSKIFSSETFVIKETYPCKSDYYFYRINDELAHHISSSAHPAYFIKIISGSCISIRLPWVLEEEYTNHIPEWKCSAKDSKNYAFPMLGKSVLNELGSIQIVDVGTMCTDYEELYTDLQKFEIENINKIISYVAFCKEKGITDNVLMQLIENLPNIQKYTDEKFGEGSMPSSFTQVKYLLERENFKLRKFVISQNIIPIEELQNDMEKGARKTIIHTPLNSEMLINNNKLLRNMFRNSRNSNITYIERPVPELENYRNSSKLEYTSDPRLIENILEATAHMAYGGCTDEVVKLQVKSLTNKIPTKDPIEHLFKTLVWDGEPRLDKWLTTTLICDPKSTSDSYRNYISEVGKSIMKSIVYKTLSPRYDITIIHELIAIFIGIQEAGKTRLAKTLAIEEAYYVAVSMNDKDMEVKFKDPLISDLAECSDYRKESVKKLASTNAIAQRTYFTQQVERHRVKSTLIGNSNRPIQVADAQNRKFCMVPCSRKFNFDYLEEYLDQIFAETVVEFEKEREKCNRTGKPIMIINMSKEAKLEQTKYTETDLQKAIWRLIRRDVKIHLKGREATVQEVKEAIFSCSNKQGQSDRTVDNIQYVYLTSKTRKKLFIELRNIQVNLQPTYVETVLLQEGFDDAFHTNLGIKILKLELVNFKLDKGDDDDDED